MTYKRIPLYDLAKWKNGLAFRNINFSKRGRPVIKIAELKNGITEQTQLTEQTFDDEVYLRAGDMLFSWSGNPQTSIDVFWYNLPDGWLNQHIFKVTPISEIDRQYFFYLMKSLMPTFTAIASNKQTTGLGHVTVKDLKELIVDVPPLDEQVAIGAYLQSIDAKINNNTKINHHLEQIAQAIFKSWFVDFEPFGGVMPDDWREGTITDIASDIVCGKTPPTKVTEYFGDDIPFITIPDMHGRIYVTTTERSLSMAGADSQSNKTVPADSVCVSCIATAGLVVLTSKPSQTNQQINTIVCKSDISPFYVYLTMVKMADHIRMLGSSGSATNNLNKGQFSKIGICIPSAGVLNEFSALVTPVFEKIKRNQQESERLAELRDSLLPHLMSGEISVTDL